MAEMTRTIDAKELLSLLNKPLTLPIELQARKVRIGELLEQDIPEDTFICLIRALEICCREDRDEARNVIGFMARKNFMKVHVFQHILKLRPSSEITPTLTCIVALLRHFLRYAPWDEEALRSVTLIITDIAKSYPPNHQKAHRILQDLSSLGSFKKSDSAAVRSNDKIFPSTGEVFDSECPTLTGLGPKEEHPKSIGDYAAVHFQLLRQEIVEPLRIKISQFEHLKQSMGFEDACRECCVFTNVSLLQIVTTHISKGVAFRVSFTSNSLEEIEWETSRNLIFGSLVCLTSNHFHDMIFAVVAKRDPKWLVKGSVELRLLRADDIKKLVTPNLFLMVDTQTYIEEHFSVLNSLQRNINEGEPIAFSEHIVSLSSADKRAQLIQEKPNLTYDIGSLVRDEASSQPSWHITWNVSLTKPEDWPDSSRLNVDDHQLKAIKSALMNEVTIIKGAPGTGKTYTCLKIVQLKLLNKQKEPAANIQNGTIAEAGPILFICSTRASLDEFCRGVSRFQVEDVIRYGGKAQVCDTLGTLEGQRTKFPVTHDQQCAEQLKSCNKSIQGITQNMKNIVAGILSADALRPVIDEVHFRSFREGVKGGMLLWLLLGKITQEMYLRLKRQIPDRQPSNGREDDTRLEGYLLMDIHPTKLNADPVVRRLVEHIHHAPIMIERDVQMVTDIWKLPLQHRWSLYRFWIRELLLRARDQAERIYRKMEDITKGSQSAHDEVDYRILKSASVIAMTSSAAAKVRRVLKRLRTRMVIIDEAGDVLQSTSAAILPTHSQQLVLIGNSHPKISQNHHVKRLAAENGTSASLIERLLMKKYPEYKLASQHRMSPVVSQISRKLSLTDEFEHDPSTTGTSDIADIANNVFFIEYTNQPASAKYESSFLMKLSVYLKEKGYNKDQITILTTFPQQLALLENVNQHCQLNTLDEFRGESDFVLFLSNGCERKSYPGCLEIDQRLISVLSFARKALYIIGDFKYLASKNAVWAKVIAVARNLKWVDEGLRMKCRRHPDTSNIVTTSFEFIMAQHYDSGCGLPCNIRLECGHACKHDCHDHDADPDRKCMSPCRKIICKNGHTCKNPCHAPCETRCNEPVLKELPCGHQQPVLCHLSRGNVVCRNRCERILHCGHQCTNQCGLTCTDRCLDIFN